MLNQNGHSGITTVSLDLFNHVSLNLANYDAIQMPLAKPP